MPARSPSEPHSENARVLFLCTGNYYRSRLAEHYFNHLAPQKRLVWQADSRGLNIRPGVNPGPLSPHTISWLRGQGIPLPEPLRLPEMVQEADFWRAQRIIAVKEAEHRPLMEERFPHWSDRVEYWSIHDLDVATPAAAIPQLVAKVDQLLNTLAK